MISLLAFVSLGSIEGCSGGVASTAPVQINQDDANKAAVFRANHELDLIEKTPAAQRQLVANIPANAKALSAASKIDSGVKSRIDALGIQVK